MANPAKNAQAANPAKNVQAGMELFWKFFRLMQPHTSEIFDKLYGNYMLKTIYAVWLEFRVNSVDQDKTRPYARNVCGTDEHSAS